MRIFMGNRMLAGAKEGEMPIDVSLEMSAVVQVVTALRAENSRPVNRGNRTVLLKFSVKRTHASEQSATEFLLLHGVQLRDLEGSVTLIHEALQSRAIYVENAVLKRVFGSQQGNRTTHFYEILGGNLRPHEEEIEE